VCTKPVAPCRGDNRRLGPLGGPADLRAAAAAGHERRQCVQRARVALIGKAQEQRDLGGRLGAADGDVAGAAREPSAAAAPVPARADTRRIARRRREPVHGLKQPAQGLGHCGAKGRREAHNRGRYVPQLDNKTK
jgi:hypothetical protein